MNNTNHNEVPNMFHSILRMPVLLLLGVFLLALPCSLAAQATTPGNSRLQGTVFSGTLDDPVYSPGVTVTLYGDTGIASTVTDQDGKFAFANIEVSEIYFIEASHKGFYAQRNVMVEAGSVVQVSLHLEASDPNMSTKP
jgi:hypothetical protein